MIVGLSVGVFTRLHVVGALSLIVLAAFVALGVLATRRFRPMLAQPA
jgi:hypothetical protein